MNLSPVSGTVVGHAVSRRAARFGLGAAILLLLTCVTLIVTSSI